jgi:hypothetical protein
MPKPTTPWVPWTVAAPVSRRKPAPKQEPLSSRRTRLKLVARTLLDAIDRHERSLNSKSSNEGEPSLWELGSYADLLACVDELRASGGHRSRGVADCFWAVYIAGSTQHMSRRGPRAELCLDWLNQHSRLVEVFVPKEVSEAGGYSPAEARLYERPRRLPTGLGRLKLVGGSAAAQSQEQPRG